MVHLPVGLEDQLTCRIMPAFCREILLHSFVKQWKPNGWIRPKWMKPNNPEGWQHLDHNHVVLTHVLDTPNSNTQIFFRLEIYCHLTTQSWMYNCSLRPVNIWRQILLIWENKFQETALYSSANPVEGVLEFKLTPWKVSIISGVCQLILAQFHTENHDRITRIIDQNEFVNHDLFEFGHTFLDYIRDIDI